MVKRKIQSKKIYILAFLIGTFIFLNVFLLTYTLSYFEYQRISNIQQQLSYDIFEDKLYYSLFDKNMCSVSSFKEISEDLRFQGAIIDELEHKFGKNDKNVLFRKKYYSLIELEHFEFTQNMVDKCGLNISTIFFFYSNKEADIKKSEDAGKLLDSVFQRNSNLMIYSFDINLDDDLIASLRDKYNITMSPTMIIDEKIKVESPNNIDNLEKYL